MPNPVVVIEDDDKSEVRSESKTVWCPSLKLFKADKDILEHPHPWLSDDLINAGQQLLRSQFGHVVSGLQETCKACKLSMDIETVEFVQVLKVADSHWILISTVNCPPAWGGECVYMTVAAGTLQAETRKRLLLYFTQAKTQ